MRDPAAQLGLLVARLRARASDHPRAVDALLAVGLYVVLTLGITSDAEADREGGAVLGALVNLAVVGPLAFRTRGPTLVLAVVATASGVVALTLGPTGAEAAILVALATVASRETSVRRLWTAITLVAAGLVAAALLLAPHDVLRSSGAGAAAITAAVAVGLATRARRDQRAALADRAERLERERVQEAELAVAAERARIARELHDVVAHNVSVMVALADGAQHTVGGDPDTARDAIGQVASVGREALTELRGLLGVLRDPAVAGASRAPQPGIDQLDELVGRVRAAGLQATVRVTGRPMAISAPAEMTIYRIAQEALTNALRHGDGTTSVEVRVRWRTDVVELEITDDGRTPRGVTGSPDGRGVAGMRERAGMHGAELSAGPRPGGGWLVATRIPLRADSAVRT